MKDKLYNCCNCGHHGGVPRRSFLAAMGGSAMGGAMLTGCATTGATKRPALHARPVYEKKELVIQPVFHYHIPTRRNQTSWRGWGGIHNEQDVANEVEKIRGELAALVEEAEFPIKVLPIEKVNNGEKAAAVAKTKADLMLIYAATGGTGDLEAMIKPERHNIVFVRHQSGPVYLWYEIVSPRLLRKTVDELGQPGLLPFDVVVDCQDDLLWRFRSLYALKNTLGCKIVAIGDASGWGQGGQKAPQIARDLWKLNIIPVDYKEVGERIVAARADAALVKKATAEAREYLRQGGVKLNTDAGFVERAFLLTEVFRDVMGEAGAQALTINHCMGTIMPLSETTACLPLSLINDEGGMAFCESDFVVIPSGILLHHICGLPVFLQDPTYPHHGIVTVAHCTAPRRMDGKNLEPVNILTHYESDYGAAPKVDMKLGQTITVIDPDFGAKKWFGFRGNVVANPFMDICRSQCDISIEGDCDRLAREMVGFHWMLAYGDHRKELGYALGKVGIEWVDLTEEKLKRG